MTRTQWAILAVLTATVAIVLCVGTIMLVNLSASPSTQVTFVEATVTPLLSSGPKQTNTLALTDTPKPTERSKPTGVPTLTPIPATPIPTIRPTPAFVAQTQKIGPLLDSLRDETYSFQVGLNDVKWSNGDRFLPPKQGNTYLIAYISVKNLGPGSAFSISSLDFQVKDANGALRSSALLVPAGFDCSLPFVDLTAGGSVEGCVSFEVPTTGRLEFIYAPFKYEGLKPGRYVSFVIRP